MNDEKEAASRWANDAFDEWFGSEVHTGPIDRLYRAFLAGVSWARVNPKPPRRSPLKENLEAFKAALPHRVLKNSENI